jgi:hypothetical protein
MVTIGTRISGVKRVGSPNQAVIDDPDAATYTFSAVSIRTGPNWVKQTESGKKKREM